MEEGLNRLEPEGEADWTGVEDSWVGGVVIVVELKDSEGRGDRRPGEA